MTKPFAAWSIIIKQNELDSLIETFKLRSREESNDNHDNVINFLVENKKLDQLIIMDDVSGVADISKKFANFLTVSRKFGYNCVYVFHVINPSSQIWQKIISQTNSFNIFPASVPYNTVAKILQSNCILQSKKYVPARSLWLSKVFTDLANSHEKHCLTIDVAIEIEMDLVDIGHQLIILKNRFAISINQTMMFFIIHL